MAEARQAPRRDAVRIRGNSSHLNRQGRVPYRESGHLAEEGAGPGTRQEHWERSEISLGARRFSSSPQQRRHTAGK